MGCVVLAGEGCDEWLKWGLQVIIFMDFTMLMHFYKDTRNQIYSNLQSIKKKKCKTQETWNTLCDGSL